MGETESNERQAWLERLKERSKGSFWEYLGCVAEVADPDRAVVVLEAQKHHLNALGIVHGGVLSSLLDNAMGLVCLCARPSEKVVTTNMNIHYVAALGAGRLTAEATILHESRSTITVQGEVRDASGKLGTIATGSFRVIG